MKKKSSSRARATPKTQVSSPVIVWVNGESVSHADLEKKTPAELLQGLPPELRNTLLLLYEGPQKAECNNVPAWAKCAADKFYKWVFPPGATSEPYQYGWIFGLGCEFQVTVNDIAKRNPQIQPFCTFFESLLKSLPPLVAQESTQVAGDFYDGARAAKAKAQNIENLPHNPKCLFLIWIAWRLFERKSMGEVHRQFIEWGVITPSTESRQTRALLSAIGFPAGKAGRPKKK